ncbi:MAG TPA: rhodanese-like domain-containing protein [Gaiellaceae bacterium]|nr:rhodanese-like domain-containing protein [Gaiellaceae bacterium]
MAEVSVLADEYLGERDEVEQLSAPELEERLARGDVVVLDVRPEQEFRAGHIAGARSVPLSALDEVVSALPRRREIVAYCRGPYCVYADDAVRLLRARGLKARRLDVGFPEWRRAGLPVEIAS